MIDPTWFFFGGQRYADIDECQKEETNNCKFKKLCKNVEGGYNCSCPMGYLQKDDGKGSEGCIPKPKKSYQALVAGILAGNSLSFVLPKFPSIIQIGTKTKLGQKANYRSQISLICILFINTHTHTINTSPTILIFSIS